MSKCQFSTALFYLYKSSLCAREGSREQQRTVVEGGGSYLAQLSG